MTGLEEQATPRRRTELRALAAAVSFLTRVPLGRWVTLDAEDVARAGAVFPLVGAGIGAAVGGVALALTEPLTGGLAAVLALAAGAVLTGALHLDALADSADALGARSRERALEIMRDHAIGSYGAVTVAVDLLLKAGALSALASRGQVVRFAVAAGALSRAAPVLLAALLPYARAGGGLGVPLTRGSRARASVAVVLAAGVALAAAGVKGAAVAAVAAAVVVTLGFGFRRWLGGVTGDTLGAAVEASELAVLVAAVALDGTR